MADLTNNTNYLQPTGFRVSINRENYPNLEYFAQSVSHPSMELNPVDAPFKRLNVAFAGDKIQHNPVSIIFMMDEDMTAYIEMFQWMERLVNKPQSSVIAKFSDNTEIPTFSDITVTVLSSHNNINKIIKYKNCIPISLGDVEFTAVSDGQYLTFPGTFRFDYFEVT
tara:strand:- start:10020 stop:10520 length:501 start_codon:yes stop_codon:yes gene_type:complete